MNVPDYYKTTNQYDLNEKNFSILNKILSDKMLSKNKSDRLLAIRLKSKWNQACDNAECSAKRNRQLKNDFVRIESHMKLLSERIERQRKFKDEYASMIDRKYPGWKEIASHCETFDDVRRYTQKQERIQQLEKERLVDRRMQNESIDSIKYFSSMNNISTEKMHGSSSQIPPQHSFPQELPPTLHHDYHVPQKHDHYLLQQRQQQQPHHQQQQQQPQQQQQQQQQYNIHHQPPPPFQQNPPLTTSYESACAHLTDGRRDNESSLWRSNIVDVTANRASLNLDAYASNESIGNVDNTIHQYRDRLVSYEDLRCSMADRSITRRSQTQLPSKPPLQSTTSVAALPTTPDAAIVDIDGNIVPATIHISPFNSALRRLYDDTPPKQLSSNRCPPPPHPDSQSRPQSDLLPRRHYVNTADSPHGHGVVERDQLPFDASASEAKSLSPPNQRSPLAQQSVSQTSLRDQRDRSKPTDGGYAQYCDAIGYEATRDCKPTSDQYVSNSIINNKHGSNIHYIQNGMASGICPNASICAYDNHSPLDNHSQIYISGLDLETSNTYKRYSALHGYDMDNYLHTNGSAGYRSLKKESSGLVSKDSDISERPDNVQPVNHKSNYVPTSDQMLESKVTNCINNVCQISKEEILFSNYTNLMMPPTASDNRIVATLSNDSQSQIGVETPVLPQSVPPYSLRSRPSVQDSLISKLQTSIVPNATLLDSLPSFPQLSNPFQNISSAFPDDIFPVTPLPVTPLSVTPLPVTPLPVTPISVTPISVRPISVTPLPVIPLLVTPLPVTPLPVTPLPVTPLSVTPLSVIPLPVTPLSVIPLPVTPLPVTPLPVTPLPAPYFPIALLSDSIFPHRSNPQLVDERFHSSGNDTPGEALRTVSMGLEQVGVQPDPSTTQHLQLSPLNGQYSSMKTPSHINSTIDHSLVEQSRPSPQQSNVQQSIPQDTTSQPNSPQHSDPNNSTYYRHSAPQHSTSRPISHNPHSPMHQSTLHNHSPQHSTPQHSMPALLRCTSPTPSNISRSSHTIARPVTIPAAQQYQCSSPDRTLSSTNNSPVKQRDSADYTESVVPSLSYSSYQGQKVLLSTCGLYRLLTAINTSLSEPMPRSECFYRTIAPQASVKANVIDTANAGQSLRAIDITSLTMVVRDQLPLVVAAECHNTGLLDDHLLTSNDLLTLTCDDVSYRLEETCVELWFEVSYHMTQLRKHDIMSSSEIAAVFSSSLIDPRSLHHDKVHQLILSLMGRVKVNPEVSRSPETSTMASLTNKSQTESLIHREESIALESAMPADYLSPQVRRTGMRSEGHSSATSPRSRGRPTDGKPMSSKLIIENLAKQIIRLNSESDEEDNFFALRPPTDLRNSDLYKSLASAATMQDDDDGFSDIDDMLNPKGQGHGVRESYQSGYMPSGNASTLGYLTTSAADITQNSLTENYIDGRAHGETDEDEDEYEDDEEFTTKKKVLDLMAKALNANIDEFDE